MLYLRAKEFSHQLQLLVKMKVKYICSMYSLPPALGKAVPQHNRRGAGGTGSIARTHSRPWH
jgi:hypothetical protein